MENSKYSFTQFDYVKISDEELDAIFATDGVLLQYENDVARFTDSIKSQQEAQDTENKVLGNLSLKEAELLGELRSIDRQKRETRGRISSCVSQIRKAEQRIKERLRRAEVRRRQLFISEQKKRLLTLGREITRKTHAPVQSKIGNLVRQNVVDGKANLPEDPVLGGSQSQGEGGTS